MSDQYDESTTDDFRDNPVTLENGEWRETETAMPPSPAPRQPRPQPAQTQPVPQPQAIYDEETYTQQFANPALSDEEEEDYSDILNDASLRLEQGQLYQMIMNHDLFQGSNADPKAIKAVTRQIRKFAKEQMEIMLGMKSPAQDTPRATEGSPSPFNSLEVEILKNLAYAASKGKTAEPEAEKIAVGLNPIRVVLKQAARPAPIQPKPLAAKPAAPVQRQPAQKTAPGESAFKPLDKDPSQMTVEELKAYNQRITERQKNRRAKSPGALPMPTYEQEEMLATQRAVTASNQVSAIMALINNQKRK